MIDLEQLIKELDAEKLAKIVIEHNRDAAKLIYQYLILMDDAEMESRIANER